MRTLLSWRLRRLLLLHLALTTLLLLPPILHLMEATTMAMVTIAEAVEGVMEDTTIMTEVTITTTETDTTGRGRDLANFGWTEDTAERRTDACILTRADKC